VFVVPAADAGPVAGLLVQAAAAKTTIAIDAGSPRLTLVMVVRRSTGVNRFHG
jgi:hypothetical protein